MDSKNNGKGFIIQCTSQGFIKEVFRNELNEDFPFELEESIYDFLDPHSYNKYRGFCDEVAEFGAGLGWELNLQGEAKMMTLTFAGVPEKEDLFVVAAEHSGHMLDYYEAFLKEGSQHVNKIRNIMEKSYIRNSRLLKNGEIETYHRISTLNNELTNIQRELTKKNIELKRLDEQKNEYLGMAVHDLRNPLGTIMGYSEILKSEIQDKLNIEQKDMLDTVYSSSEYMLKIIDDFLDVSKIQLGKLTLERHLTNLDELVAHSVTINHIVAEQKDINLNYVLKGEAPFVSVDPGKINQVLNNLIGNSIKFSSSQSSIKVTLSSNSEEVIIEVVDQGLGISINDRDKLFKPYQQTETKSTKGEKGEGLGLAIVKKIVEGHGGVISVYSEEGKGSKFSVVLPNEK